MLLEAVAVFVRRILDCVMACADLHAWWEWVQRRSSLDVRDRMVTVRMQRLAQRETLTTWRGAVLNEDRIRIFKYGL